MVAGMLLSFPCAIAYSRPSGPAAARLSGVESSVGGTIIFIDSVI